MLRKAFTRHGLGMPAHTLKTVRQCALATASRCAGPPTAPPLDPVFAALNQGQLPTRRGPHAEQVRLRRAEEIETLSHRTVVELNAESRLAPERRVATIARRLNASNGWPASGPAAPIAASSSASRVPSVPTDGGPGGGGGGPRARSAGATRPAGPGWEPCRRGERQGG